MSARSPQGKRLHSDGKSLLDETLDFGPEETATVKDSDLKRLENILKQIEDISARIDKLAGDL